MAEPRQHFSRESSPAPSAPPMFAAPRLELPRFQFAPLPAANAVAAPPRPAQITPPPAPRLFVHQTPTRPRPITHAPAPAPAPVAVAPSPITSSPTARTLPSSVTWSTPVAATPPSQRSLLQRVRPVHMGMLMVVVVMIMAMTSGPAAMHTAPSKLPAAVAGGGADGLLPPRTGMTTSPTAPARAGRAAKETAAPRMLHVGTATLPATVTAGGIPSPAASAQLAVNGGGRLASGQTGVVTMAGMPSPAAAAKLGPEQLPFRPSDGVTLPRTEGERDSHAVDSHYAPAALPMEEAAAPVATPGDSAAHAERQVTLNELTGGTTAADPMPAAPAAGYSSSY